VAGRLEPPHGIGGKLTERRKHCFADAAEVCLIGVECLVKACQRAGERPFELRPGAPGQPAVCRRFKQGLDQPEVVAVAMENSVSMGGRAQQGQTVAVGHQPAARRMEGKVGPTREGDAEGLPVEAPVKQPEVGSINVVG